MIEMGILVAEISAAEPQVAEDAVSFRVRHFRSHRGDEGGSGGGLQVQKDAVSIIPFGINNAVPVSDLSFAEARLGLGVGPSEKNHPLIWVVFGRTKALSIQSRHFSNWERTIPVTG